MSELKEKQELNSEDLRRLNGSKKEEKLYIKSIKFLKTKNMNKDSLENNGSQQNPSLGDNTSNNLGDNRREESNKVNSENVSVNNDNNATAATDQLDSPYFPKMVYQRLPKLLKEAVEPMTEFGDREKDVFLISALGILSGLFPKVEGQYNRSRLAPPLNVFVIAPAASGKGVMVNAKILGTRIHREFLEENKKKINEFKDRRNKNNIESDKASSAAPIKPLEVVLYIPGNISSAAVINHLSNNDGFGIIAESEADTVTVSLKQDWGGFSDLIRKTFHHETVSSSRKGKDGFMLEGNFHEIERPKLAIVITGTPGQVRGLVDSPENGLFSRFCYYSYKKEPKWRDVTSENGIDLDSYYSNLSDEVYKIHKFYKEPYSFVWTKKQWKSFNKSMKTMFENVEKETLFSSVFRLGVIAYRVAMTLSIMRHYENNKSSTSKEIACNEDDFLNAIDIVKVLNHHSKRVESLLSYKSKTSDLGYKYIFLNGLPKGKFKKEDALKIAKKLKIADRTAARRLKEYEEKGLLKKISKGSYFK